MKRSIEDIFRNHDREMKEIREKGEEAKQLFRLDPSIIKEYVKEVTK